MCKCCDAGLSMKETFKAARSLYRRSQNLKFRTPIRHDEAYTMSGRNGSWNPFPRNIDEEFAYIYLHSFGCEQNRAWKAITSI